MKAVAVILAATLLVGCKSTAPWMQPNTEIQAPPIRESATFPATFDRTWASVVAVLADQSFPIQIVEKESGLITTQLATFASGALVAEREVKRISTLRCSMCIIESGRYSLNVTVRADSDSTTVVKVKTHIEALDTMWGGGRWKIVQSNGAIEDAVFARIGTHLGK